MMFGINLESIQTLERKIHKIGLMTIFFKDAELHNKKCTQNFFTKYLCHSLHTLVFA